MPESTPAAVSVRAATDVGGTFTDLVCLVDDPDTGEQRIVTAKSDTTPPRFERGVLDVLQKGQVPLDSVAQLAHGTTVVINALTERKGVRTALLTTEGFRDTLEIARGNRPDFFNLHYEKPPPFVPRYLRREVPGRLAPDGSERTPLDLGLLPEILDCFRAERVEAVAIVLLHSYANPEHELEVARAVREHWPEVAVVASHQISRQWREYERTSTTALSAYVQPVAARYLERLVEGVGAAGFEGQLYVMQSNCGIDTVERASEIPITMVESGPASGFKAAADLGQLIGEPNVLALDIGGTTAKCSLIEQGEVRIVSDYWIERDARSAGYPILVPVVDLVEIGNGGGSVAWLDDFGKLHVGPRSAGAAPGPAAYGLGGTEPTTTDANLALGRINPGYFKGGEVGADMDAVANALRTIAGPYGDDAAEAARAIVRIANNSMVNALKVVSVNRGHDPRDFTLVAFGGGGGMHAVALARELAMRRVVVPRAADVFSALGMLMSDLRRDYFVTKLLPLAPQTAGALDAALREVEARARGQFADESIDAERVRLDCFCSLRYENQEHAVEVPLPGGRIEAATVPTIRESFDALYEREYSYTLDAPVEVVGIHVVARAEVGKLALGKLPRTGATLEQARKGSRMVDYAPEGVHEAEIYAGALLEPGMELRGPAIIESTGTTVVIHPGDEMRVDDYGNFVIEIGGGAP
jgi:N-methylhydantoinase A